MGSKCISSVRIVEIVLRAYGSKLMGYVEYLKVVGFFTHRDVKFGHYATNII